MHADTMLIILLTALGSAAIPLAAWIRARIRIRELELMLTAQANEVDRHEELRDLVQQLAAQTDELTDHQALLARRLSERLEAPPTSRGEPQRAVTPH
jgi:hypothetical protein